MERNRCMKAIERLIPLLFLLAFVAVISACGVTETGNPYPDPQPPTAGDEPAEASADNYYSNSTYGVVVEYPDGWSVSAPAGSDATDLSVLSEVVFSDGREEATTADMNFERPASEPSSLFSYLTSTYPGRVFAAYNTATLDGYVYDDPSSGTNGGDQREYFFLGGDVLVHVVAEIFDEGADELDELLEGITIQ